MLLPKLTEQLIEAIRGSGLSLNEIESRSGVSRSALSRLLRGERSISIANLEKVCDALGIEVAIRTKRTVKPVKKGRSYAKRKE